MSFARDTAAIERCIARDPSFRNVDPTQLRHARRALDGAHGSETFVLAAMRLAALARNGHTRVIPNAAIKVVPARFVAIGTDIALTDADLPGWRPGILRAVNGVEIEAILARADPYLAGSPARQRVIGANLASWPAALVEFGVPAGPLRYRLSDASGTAFDLPAGTSLVPADRFYPVSEPGHLSADPSPAPFADLRETDGAWHLRLPSFFSEDETLEHDLKVAADTLLTHPNRPIIFDLRGNTGGSFLKALPLLDALGAHWRGPAAALLVDKFTFSAAIVFAALVRDRLPTPVPLIGETMGDHATFWAEGATEPLPDTGASFRYSTAFHDWQTGTPHPTTPPDIARHLIAAGPLTPDIPATRTLWDLLAGHDPPLAAALAHLSQNT